VTLDVAACLEYIQVLIKEAIMISTKMVTTGDRVVFADKAGHSTRLLPGDPEKDDRGIRALSELLAEGWTVKATVASGEGAYFVLTHTPG
jgi:hypothetical protein